MHLHRRRHQRGLNRVARLWLASQPSPPSSDREPTSASTNRSSYDWISIRGPRRQAGTTPVLRVLEPKLVRSTSKRGSGLPWGSSRDSRRMAGTKIRAERPGPCYRPAASAEALADRIKRRLESRGSNRSSHAVSCAETPEAEIEPKLSPHDSTYSLRPKTRALTLCSSSSRNPYSNNRINAFVLGVEPSISP